MALPITQNQSYPAFAKDSKDGMFSSAIRYEEVDLSLDDFVPTHPFKGLHVGGDGNVVIVGLDGNAITLALTAGSWSYGGIAIGQTGTTATGIVALY